ncbi:MAG: hypothetical protein RR792_00960, partial [Thermomonas sp.]
MPILQHAGPRLLLLAALLAPGLAMGASKPKPTTVATDPMEASLAGEFALQAGQLPEAARQYLQAARSANDPVLAERATRIALLADEDALARDAFKVWQSLAPEGGQAQRMVAAGLALRAGDKRASRRELRALLAEEGGKGWRSALAALFGAVGKQQKLVVAMIDGIVDDQALPNDLQAWLGFGGLAQRLEQPALV